MRCGQQTSEWYVFENHAEWRMCLFLDACRASFVAPAERVVSRLRAVARFVRRSCAVLLSVVSSFSVCVVTSLCD